MELSKEEQDEILDIVASVLHLGNVSFTEEEGVAEVEHPHTVDVIAKVSISSRSQKLSTFPQYFNATIGLSNKARFKWKSQVKKTGSHWLL